ncbi:MAG: AI-2E family transporter [Dysgonomonas sp.]
MSLNIKEQYRRYSLIILIIVMGFALFQQFVPFLGGLLGASAIYILVRGQMERLTSKRKLRRSIAATIILIASILCFLIPISVAVWLLVIELNNINLNPTEYLSGIQHFIDLIQERTGYNVLSVENLTSVAAFLPKIAQVFIDSVSSFVINTLVLVFILYFMLISGPKMESYLYSLLPFTEKNKKEVMSSVNMLVKSTAIGIPLLATVQGVFATIGYMVFDSPSPVMFGFLTCFATIIPLVGTMLIWCPLVIYMGLTGDWANAIGLAIYALIVISNIDNLVRFMLQKKIADTHPLITVFGVIVGLPLFGFWGVIFGPLLLSIFILCVDIFKREHLDDKQVETDITTNNKLN